MYGFSDVFAFADVSVNLEGRRENKMFSSQTFPNNKGWGAGIVPYLFTK